MKQFYNLLVLCLMAVGVNAQTKIAEVDFTTATEFTNWYQFAEEQAEGKVELLAGEALAITVDVQTGQLWQPQIMAIPDDSFNLEKDRNYKVVITAKFPTAGTLQINMGSWISNDQDRFAVRASNDYQTVECNFKNWSVNAVGAHLMFQCGDFKGTTLVKSIEVYDMSREGGEGDEIVLYENDFTGITEFTDWYQFAEAQKGSVDVDPEGVAITVDTQTGQLWQPQVMIVPHGSFNLVEDGTYIVSITAKYPCNGKLQINMGTWNLNDQDIFEVTSTGDFQTDKFLFEGWSATLGGCHLLFQCGDFKGTIILKKIQIIDLGGDNQFNVGDVYYRKGKDNTASVICGKVKYSGDVVIPSQVTYNGKAYSVTSIDSYAFNSSSGLKSVTIPNSVKSIGYFAFEYCSSLTTIISEIENPFGIDSYTFDSDTYNNAELIVPKGTKALYQAKNGWNRFTKITEAQSTSKNYSDYIWEAGVNNDWGAYAQPLYCANQDGIYSGFFYAQEADWSGGKGAFKFTGAFNSWDEGNYGTGTINDDGLTGTLIDDGGSGNVLATPGFYKAEVNLAEMTYSLTPITSIGLIGPVLEGGWNTDTELTYNPTTRAWEVTIDLEAGEFKFRANHSWDINWGGSLGNLIQDGPNLEIEKAGKYFIQFFPLCETKSYAIITASGSSSEIGSIFKVNGIYYEIGDNNTVSVTSGEVKYSGDVVIPEQVTYNGKSYSVMSIGIEAFDGCKDMTSISIPNSVTSIEPWSFSGCSGLNTIVIPNSVEYINQLAFSNCSGLTSITFLGSLTCYDDAFWGCNNLTAVHILDLETFLNNEYEMEEDPFSNPLSYAQHLFMNGEEIKDLIIPNTISKINANALWGCSGLTSITIPNSVTSIGSSAFWGCSGLMTIVSEIEKPYIIDECFDSDVYLDAELIVPKGTKRLYQATEGWSQFAKITEVADNDEALFTIDGTTYQGTKSEKTVVVKAVDTSRTWMEIPASVSYDGMTYQVTGIADGVFDGSSMAALIWNVESALTNSAFNNASIGSNFLLYVKSSSYAPSSVKNVIVDGSAQKIVLSDDGGQFYCPQAFTARSISYTHNYSMETGLGKAKGWETIALPFDVQKISHNTRGEIVPFPAYNSSSNQKPFWLANFSGSSFRRTAAVLANEPYIIAMPNSSSYRNEYNLAGDVTFSADNVQVPKTPSFSGTFMPAFATVAKSSSVYAMNVNNRSVKYSGSYDAGSRFISGLREVHPFEAYMTGSFSRGVIEINFDDGTTSLNEELRIKNEESAGATDGEIVIYSLSGQQVARTSQRDFDAVWNHLSKGVYIVDGKKLIK